MGLLGGFDELLCVQILEGAGGANPPICTAEGT